ncbi:hypothetical protein TIFTF001_034411 [Ficus carica]|uniref:Uncharacterized protein n=1 Tax=Ficus carica TaxID=3494 RepID=A0AA88DZV9_FICCA|nr:hypothetical protein TIFTF001_034411 [Ficus carica]
MNQRSTKGAAARQTSAIVGAKIPRPESSFLQAIAHKKAHCSSPLPCFRGIVALSSSATERLWRSPSHHMRAASPFSSAALPAHMDD